MNSPAQSLPRIVIATRRSRLALWQAEHIKQRLEARHAGLKVDLLPMSTRGDEMLEARLDQAGGKGLFIKELEVALAEGRADLAVHSMKDVPVEMPDGFLLAAITEREDPRDAFVSNRYATLDELPQRAVLGTSSLRRAAQIAERYPTLEMRTLRGNVETRLKKLDGGEYDAIVLAAAGLKRLGLGARIRAYLEPEQSLPAAGQGALGIECRADRKDVIALVATLADPATAACVRAERAVSRALGGNCALPLAAFARVDGSKLKLAALVASVDGKRIARAECEGALAAPESLGERAADLLRAHGAVEILAGIATPGK